MKLGPQLLFKVKVIEIECRKIGLKWKIKLGMETIQRRDQFPKVLGLKRSWDC
jgi:hypothetical protein